MVNRVGRTLVLAGAVCVSLLAQVYDGPSVLSRGGSGRPYGSRSTRDSNLRAYVSLAGFADSGFFPAALSQEGGRVQVGTVFGLEGSVGAYGTKRFNRGQIGLDYNGTYRHYPLAVGINGTDHFLGVDFQKVLTQRLTLKGQSTAGTSNRVFSFANVVGGGAGTSFLPLNDLFDARVYFARTTMAASYRISRRVQLEFQADGFTVRRVKSLTGVNGYTAGMSMNYRLNQRQWIGGLYNFVHFDYPKAFGEADLHMFGALFVHNFTRYLQLETTVGAYRSDVAGTRQVAADPIVRELLGINFINEAFSRASTLPLINISLRGSRKTSAFTASYARSPNAGNGVLQTSTGENMMAAYSYTPDRKITLSTSTSFLRTRSLGASIPGYAAVFAAGNISYQVTRGFQVYSTVQYRHTDVIFGSYPRNTQRIGIGLTYTNSAIPITYF